MGRLQRLVAAMAVWVVGLVAVLALTGVPCAGSLWVGVHEPTRPLYRPGPPEGELARVLALSFAVSGGALGTVWSGVLGLTATILVLRRPVDPDAPSLQPAHTVRRSPNATMYLALLD